MSPWPEQIAHDSRVLQRNRKRTALVDPITRKFHAPLAAMKNAVVALVVDPRLATSQLDELLPAIMERENHLNGLAGDLVEVSRPDLQSHAVAAIASRRLR
jgi:hypothetical protein